MAQENVIVKLSTGGEAVLRGFVKIKDRKAIRRAMFEGQTTEMDTDGELGDTITVSMSNVMDVIDVKIERLLLSFDGDSDAPYEALMESDSEDDYLAIQEAVSEIFGDNDDAKAAKAKKGSAGVKTTKES